MDKNIIKIQFFQNKYEVLISNNEEQWNIIYYNKNINNCIIILKAYVSIGYEDKTDFKQFKFKKQVFKKENFIYDELKI